MTIHDWLIAASDTLKSADFKTSRLDTLVLLEDATGRDRAWLLANPDTVLKSTKLDILTKQVKRRLQHEPLAYIRGHSEFYGRTFIVTPDVLVPRPESETMIELLRTLAPQGAQVADIGTGSGALAITAVLETGAVACAVDIDEACLAVAKRNAVRHTASVQLLQGDLLEPFLGAAATFAPEVMLANLPYVPTDFPINEAARHEPGLALFGGADGLDLYRRLFAQLTELPTPPQLLLTEALPEQHAALTALALVVGYQQVQKQDFIQVFAPRS